MNVIVNPVSSAAGADDGPVLAATARESDAIDASSETSTEATTTGSCVGRPGLMNSSSPAFAPPPVSIATVLEPFSAGLVCWIGKVGGAGVMTLPMGTGGSPSQFL